MRDYQQLLNQLCNKEIESLTISKAEYLQFREQLVKSSKFKHLRGEAKQGGDVVFTFLDIPRT